MSLALDIGPVFITAFVLVVLASAVINAVSSDGRTKTRREKLRRNSEYVDIVEEDSESGYGLAIRDSDDGVELLSFNGEDEIYQRTWVGPSELAGAADALSMKACEKEREF